MLSRLNVLAALLVGVSWLNSAHAAAPYVNGSFTTPVRSGTFKFTPLRRVIQFGYEGTFAVAGKTHPGSFYTIRGTSNVGMVWYYGVTGYQAGSAVLSPAGGTTYVGTINFYGRQGNVIESGTITVNITYQ